MLKLLGEVEDNVGDDGENVTKPESRTLAVFMCLWTPVVLSDITVA